VIIKKQKNLSTTRGFKQLIQTVHFYSYTFSFLMKLFTLTKLAGLFMF